MRYINRPLLVRKFRQSRSQERGTFINERLKLSQIRH
jgi:hypothetical protein